MKKKTIFEAIKEKLKEKPVTQEEIERLKLEAEKYRLKADIAKSKATIKKAKGGSSSTLKDLVGDEKSTEKSFDYGREDSKEKNDLRKKTLGY